MLNHFFFSFFFIYFFFWKMKLELDPNEKVNRSGNYQADQCRRTPFFIWEISRASGGASTFIDNSCKLQQYWSRFSSHRWVFTVVYLSILGSPKTWRLPNTRMLKYEVRVIYAKCFYHHWKRAEHEICLHLSEKLHYYPDPSSFVMRVLYLINK